MWRKLFGVIFMATLAAAMAVCLTACTGGESVPLSAADAELTGMLQENAGETAAPAADTADEPEEAEEDVLDSEAWDASAAQEETSPSQDAAALPEADGRDMVITFPQREEGQLSTLPLDISLYVVAAGSGTVTVRVDNYSGYEMTYSLDWHLEREEDGIWVTVEPIEPVVETGETAAISDLTTADILMDLAARYGALPPAGYRIVMGDLYAPFTVTGQQK